MYEEEPPFKHVLIAVSEEQLQLPVGVLINKQTLPELKKSLESSHFAMEMKYKQIS